MIEVTNADRVVFPDDGITKGMVVGYYATMAERMLAHSADRPLTLERFPRGIAAKGFMQKNAPEHFPDFIGRFETPRRNGTTVHPVVATPDGIVFLANHGTITFHTPATTIHDPFRPDRIIFDLDPAEGDWPAARDAAVLVRESLAALDVPSTAMLTGSKGYHVITAIEVGPDAFEVAEFTQLLSALLVADRPELLTLAFRRERRDGRVFMDWLRNTPGATGVAPWSLRPRRGAPVAVPVTWTELENTPPDSFHLEDVVAGDLVDPLVEAVRSPVDIRPAIRAAAETAAERGIEPEPFDRFRS